MQYRLSEFFRGGSLLLLTSVLADVLLLFSWFEYILAIYLQVELVYSNTPYFHGLQLCCVPSKELWLEFKEATLKHHNHFDNTGKNVETKHDL